MGESYLAKQTTVAVLLSNVSGGGTYRHAQELVQTWTQRGNRVLYICFIRRLTKIVVYEAGCEPQTLFLYGDVDLEQTAKVMRLYHTSILHVEHMLNGPQSLIHLHEKAGCSLAVTLHDYYTICPFIQLVTEGKKYCGEKGCADCLKRRQFFSPTFDRVITDISEWRGFWQTYLRRANTVMVPSVDTQSRIKKYFADIPIRFVENPEMVSYRPASLMVGIIGAISTVKGAQKIKETLTYCAQNNINIHFILFGTLQDFKLTDDEAKCIDILGPYKEDEVYQQISSYPLDFFWFPAVCPETYSYTLSIPVRLRIPCLSTNLGAIASRILSNHWGAVYSWQADAAEIVDHLLSFSYQSYYNPDFVIKNDSLPDIEIFYDESLKPKEKLSNDAYHSIHKICSSDNLASEINDKLRFMEISALWGHLSCTKKIHLLFYVDYAYYLHKLRSEGFIAYMQKIKKRFVK